MCISIRNGSASSGAVFDTAGFLERDEASCYNLDLQSAMLCDMTKYPMDMQYVNTLAV